MKIMHISDLHLGKRLCEFSLLEDQKYILDEIISLCLENEAEVLLIAGDIYDRQLPPAEAVTLFDSFLTELSSKGIRTLIISGNHDSAERVSFGSKLMEESGVYFAPVYSGITKPIVLSDEYGEMKFWLLPFIKPSVIRHFFPEEEISSYDDAVRVAVQAMNIDPSERNILVAHQFVAGASVCDSEDMSVGGLDNISSDIYKNFDYAALGHIHGPQKAGENGRYSGTPLKYSFSEVNHNKSVVLIDVKEKGISETEFLPLAPMRGMRHVIGKFSDILSLTEISDDFTRVTLTDDEDIPDATGKLRSAYPNLLRLDYDNKRTRSSERITEGADERGSSPMELFKEFYNVQNGAELGENGENFVQELLESSFERGGRA